MAGQKTLLERINREYPPFMRLFSDFIVELRPFNVDSTAEALELPLKGTEFTWTKEAINLVQDYSQGSPYNLILIAQNAFKFLNNHTFTPSSVRQAYAQAFKKIISDQTVLASPSFYSIIISPIEKK